MDKSVYSIEGDPYSYDSKKDPPESGRLLKDFPCHAYEPIPMDAKV